MTVKKTLTIAKRMTMAIRHASGRSVQTSRRKVPPKSRAFSGGSIAPPNGPPMPPRIGGRPPGPPGRAPIMPPPPR